MLPARIRRSLIPVLVTISLLVAAALATPVAAKNPPGNNGTVKIDGSPWDNHPDNEPHVGCTFEVDFYGFDQGDLWAEVIFEVHPPTGHGLLLADEVFIGADDNAGGGSEAGWDASREYDLTAALSGFAAHANQGHHVKLTVHADGSQGADTKHKVFWVGPCGPETPPPNPPSNPPGGGTNPQTPPRGGTAGSTSGAAVLPNTSLDGSSIPLTILAGVALLGGSTTLGAVAVRRNRTDRD